MTPRAAGARNAGRTREMREHIMFQVVNDRLAKGRAAVPFVPSPNHGGRIRPRIVVIHDTAGTTAGGAISWFANPRSRVSAHFVVGRDGAVTQMVECDVRAWHCEPATYKGQPRPNAFSIGVEIVNPGLLRLKDGRCYDWTGRNSWPASECVEIDSRPHGGRHWWLPYTGEQIRAVDQLVRALAIAYPSIIDVVGHYEIAPARKVDPGPHFDLDRLRAILGDRHEPDTATVIAAQEALRDLLYFPGTVDGVLGAYTERAIMSFQKENGLPVTGALDAATLAMLTDPRAKPMPTGERETATKDDVKAAGSATMSEAAAVKRSSELGIAIESMNATSSVLTRIEEARATGDRAATLFDWLFSPAGLKSAATIIVLSAIWVAANRIEWTRVRDFVLGRNLGR